MPAIDAHNHFWKFNPVNHAWIDDSMCVIQKDFQPVDFESVLRDNGIDGTVVVQVDQTEEETLQLINLAKENSFIKAVVGWVDLRAENIEERLEYFSSFRELKGFRHILQGEADRALMLDPSFKNGISWLNKFGFTYDLLVYPDQLIYIPELVATFPNQTFIIDHIAKPHIKKSEIGDWKNDMLAIAEFENVFVKISGMVTEADWKNWKQTDFTPYLDTVVESFGTKRIIYGSDWPVCLVAASYSEVHSIVKEYFSKFSNAEQQAFFGENATHFYNL